MLRVEGTLSELASSQQAAHMMTSVPRFCSALVVAGLLFTACDPKQSGADSTTGVPSASRLFSPPTGKLRSAEAALATDHDTLQVPGGVVYVRPSTAAAYEHLAAAPSLLLERPDTVKAPPATTWDGGRVRRQGDRLLLQPAHGPVVAFRNVPNRQPADEICYCGDYRYMGSWPQAGFWLVKYNGFPLAFTLVDQRTGHRTQIESPDVFFPPDKRGLLLLNAQYVGGQAPPYGMAVYQLNARGSITNQHWLRELPTWGTLAGARWAGAHALVLKRSSIPERLAEIPVVSYVELQLPVTR